MEDIQTSSRHIVEADLTLTADQGERLILQTTVEKIAQMALTETMHICANGDDSCRLARQLDFNGSTGTETLTFRCVSDDENDAPCGLVNGPFLAGDRAASMIFMALGDTSQSSEM
ncbi:MAG: hypothetical protein ABIR37_03145 [Candidatus Saccharimonadales bacterium]